MNIPPKTPKITEEFKKVTRPTKGEREVTKSEKSEEAQPLAKGKEKEKATNVSNKPIGERSSAAVEGVSPADAKAQALPTEILSLIGQFAPDTKTAVAMHETSKALYKLAKETDLKKFQEFSKTHKLSMKEEMALYILLMIEQTGSMPTSEEIKKKLKVDSSLNPEKALEQFNQIEANYQEVQSIYGQLLQSAAIFAPSVKSFMVCAGVFSSIMLLVEYGILAQLGGEDNPYGLTMGGFLLLDVIVAPVLAGKIELEEARSTGLVSTFKTAITGIMTSVTQKLGL